MNYWVITNAGKVVRSDKTKPADAVSDTLPYKVSDDTARTTVSPTLFLHAKTLISAATV